MQTDPISSTSECPAKREAVLWLAQPSGHAITMAVTSGVIEPGARLTRTGAGVPDCLATVSKLLEILIESGTISGSRSTIDKLK